MQKESQQKYKETLIAKWEEHAFESLALYDYYGAEYKKIDDSCSKMDERIKQIQQEIELIQASPDCHKFENKNKIKALKKDIQDYTGRINSVAETAKKLFERSASYREDGVRALEIVETLRKFSVRTLEEIEAAQNYEEKDAEGK